MSVKKRKTKKTGSRVGLILLLLLFFSSSYFALKEGMRLVQVVVFYLQSEESSASVSDVREGTVDDLSMMLPSGQLLWQGDSYYRPVVYYTHPRSKNIYVLELNDASATDYTIAADIRTRVSLDDDLIVRESHGFFIWGRTIIMTSLWALSMLIFFMLLRRRFRAGKAGKLCKKSTKPRARPRKSPVKRSAPASNKK